MKIKTIIVEDEPLCQKVLSEILHKYCGEAIEIADITSNVEDSVRSIKNSQPQLVFLDIVLGNNANGAFDILESIDNMDFRVIFTTSSQLPNDILKALNKFGAKKYLLKPLDIDEVVESVECVINEINSNSVTHEIQDIKKMITGFHTTEKNHRLKLPVKSGFQYINHEEIVMLRSNSNSTVLFVANGEPHNSSKNLKFFTSVLNPHQFIKVSKSHLININHIVKYSVEDGGTIYLSNDCQAPLSDNYRDDFFKALDE
jgi:two-component system LytT family response regulator